MNFFLISIFGIHIKFLEKFINILLALLLSSLITLLSSTLNVFEAKSNNLVIFNKKINSAAILLKP